MDILLKAEMIGEAPRTTIIAVVPEDILGTSMEMTPIMQDTMIEVEHLVKKEIETYFPFFASLR